MGLRGTGQACIRSSCDLLERKLCFPAHEDLVLCINRLLVASIIDLPIRGKLICDELDIDETMPDNISEAIDVRLVSL